MRPDYMRTAYRSTLKSPRFPALNYWLPIKSTKISPNQILKVKNEIIRYKEERKVIRSTAKYAPAGQSTQMIVGATGESDKDIMYSATHFYKNYNMKRVYYSGYVPISTDSRLPSLDSEVPMMRENRLYQTDWLLRFYGFQVSEILDVKNPNLDMDIDPKLMWALRNLNHFPVDINKADMRTLARIPGIGMGSVHKIIKARTFRNLNWDHLKKMGIALNRAKYFIVCNSKDWERRDLDASKIKGMILQSGTSKYRTQFNNQLSLFS